MLEVLFNNPLQVLRRLCETREHAGWRDGGMEGSKEGSRKTNLAQLLNPGRMEKPRARVSRAAKLLLHHFSDGAGAPLTASWVEDGVRVDNHLTDCCRVALRVSLFIHSQMKGGAESCIFFRASLSFHLSQLSAETPPRTWTSKALRGTRGTGGTGGTDWRWLGWRSWRPWGEGQ